jgi:hypothetical protein
MVKVPFEGDTVDAEEMSFEILSGGPVMLKLDDGTLVEVDHHVGKVYRLLEKKKDDGSPIYLLSGAVKITTKAKVG